MTDIAIVTADAVNVVESREQLTLIAHEAIQALATVRIDTSSGKFRNGNGTTLAEAALYGIALKTVGAGMPVTALRQGVIDGANLSALDYFADVWASNTDGALADAAGTVACKIGQVIPGLAQSLGNSPDKLLRVDVENPVDGEIPAGAISFAQTRAFISTEQTGTGSAQNIAHGLGIAPSKVLIVPTDTTPATTGAYTATEGTHTGTNVVVTVTSGKKFKVLAWV